MIYDLQKASFLKRTAAWLLDAILFCILAVGCIWVISGIVHFDDQIHELEEYYVKYETEYNTSFDYTQEELAALTEEAKAAYDAANKALNEDQGAVNALYAAMQSIIMMTSIAIFLGKLVLEFFIPLWLRNGQTIGKKAFGVAVMRTDGVRINGVCLFIRAILGKYAVETMLPIAIFMMMMLGIMGGFGLTIMLILLLTQLGILIFTSTNSTIHDKLADTVVVDMASQMIFDSPEARLEYQKRISTDEANKKPY